MRAATPVPCRAAARGARWAGPLLLLASLAAPGRVAADEPAPLDAASIARQALPGIVRMEWRDRNGVTTLERHGVTVDPDGWIVVAGPRPPAHGTLAARFQDRRAARAEIWASDPATGITLVRVPLSGLPTLTLRDDGHGRAPPGPDVVRRAPPRLAPGVPFVLATAEGSAARGVLRANHRSLSFPDPIGGPAWDVDGLDEGAVAVVPADLGAPWLDAEGRVIGLLVGAALTDPAPAGPGDVEVRPEVTTAYAVPSSVVAVVWPLLRQQREVPRAALGVLVRPASEAVRHQLCPDCGAQEVIEVAAGGPADLASIQAMDILLRIDDLPIAPGATLADALLAYRPGDPVRVGLLRRGESRDVRVVLGRAR